VTEILSSKRVEERECVCVERDDDVEFTSNYVIFENIINIFVHIILH
jgi:hypothetical protein